MRGGHGMHIKTFAASCASPMEFASIPTGLAFFDKTFAGRERTVPDSVNLIRLLPAEFWME